MQKSMLETAADRDGPEHRRPRWNTMGCGEIVSPSCRQPSWAPI